jgi:hypothetical protein
MNNISKTYNNLPPWSRGVIAVIGIGAIGYATYTIIQNIKKAKDIKNANKISGFANDELSALRKKGINPTFSNSQFEGYALKLVQAINGCMTDTKAVKSVFSSLKNQADILSLISVFGVRFYMPCAATQPISYVRYQFDNKAFGGALPTWMEYGLSKSDISSINDMLAKNKITFQF